MVVIHEKFLKLSMRLAEITSDNHAFYFQNNYVSYCFLLFSIINCVFILYKVIKDQ